MKGGRGGTLLLAAAAIVALLLALRRDAPPDRAPRASEAVPETTRVPDASPPPEPPDTPLPERAPEPAKPGARLVGRVTDEEGHPVPGAGIWLSKEGMGPGEGGIVARAGEDGRYLCDGVDGEERMVGAIAAGHSPSELRRILPATATVFEIDFTLRRGGGTLAISVGDAEAKVLVAPVFRGHPESLGRRTVDVAGRATIEGLVPEWNRLRLRAEGRAPQTLLARLPPEGIVETDVKLGAGAVVHGTVKGADGAPAPGARVDVVGWEWAGIGVVADETGAYRMEHAPVARVEVRASSAEGAEAWTLLKLEEGREHRWDPVLLPRSDIRGRVVDEAGAPVAHASLTCWPSGTVRPNEVMGFDDPDGRFRVQGLANREHRIAVWWRAVNGPPAAEATAFPGGDPVTIVLPRAAGFLRGVIVTRDGLPAAGATARTWPTGAPDGEVRAKAAADGGFRLGPLPAATYYLELHLDGEPTLHLDGIELGADETRDLGVVRFAAGGRIRARVVGDAEAEEETLVRSLDGGVTYTVRPDGDAVLSEDLVPGRYLVSGGMAGILEEAEARAGETTEVELRLRGGALLEAVALDPSGSAVWARFEVRDAKARVVADEYGSPFLQRLASGVYTVTATDANGARDSREVAIPADSSRTHLALLLR